MPGLEDDVRQALAGVEEPELARPVTELGMVAGVAADRGVIVVALASPLPGEETRAELTRRVIDALAAVRGVVRVEVDVRDMQEHELARVAAVLKGSPPVDLLRVVDAAQAQSRAPAPRPNPFTDARTRVLAIASGKGGVGK